MGMFSKKLVNDAVCTEHDKVYSNCLLTSDPPQQNWICRKCGATGIDTVGFTFNNEYAVILEKFAKVRDENELRTLKDFGTYILEGPSEDYPKGRKDLAEELKHEAKKWILSRVRKCTKCMYNHSDCKWTSLVPCEEHQFWLDRFNITTKDLED